MRGPVTLDGMGVWEAIFTLPYLVVAAVAMAFFAAAIVIGAAQHAYRFAVGAIEQVKKPRVQLWLAGAWAVGVVAVQLFDRSVPSLLESCESLRGFVVVATNQPLGEVDVMICQSQWAAKQMQIATLLLAPLVLMGIVYLFRLVRSAREG